MEKTIIYFGVTGGILLIFNSLLLLLGSDNLNFIVLILVAVCSLPYILFILYRLLQSIRGVKIEIKNKKSYEVANTIYIFGYFFYLISMIIL
jgi:hypothetical protein